MICQKLNGDEEDEEKEPIYERKEGCHSSAAAETPIKSFV